MRWALWLSAAVGLALAGFALLALPARAEGRVALVIGNSAYPAAPLPNPKNDAVAMADLLRRLGFKTILATDLSKETMDRALGEFGQALQPGDVALLYYSGHAVQVQSSNYLMPVSARPTKTTDLVAQAIKASAFLEVMDAANTRLNIVILDACRDNPFLSAQRSVSRGLTMIQSSGSETLIAYATEEGRTAADGAGWHSPYTEALLEELPRPGQTLEDVFRNVRARVVEATRGMQKPWTSGSIGTTFYFVPPAPAAAAADSGSTGPGSSNAEIVFWESIKDSKDSEEFEAYLAQYPNGEFAPLARLRLKQLAAVAPPEPAPAAPAPAPPATDVPASANDAQLWRSIKNSNDPADFRKYLDQFPEGTSAATARTRLADLQAQQLWDSIKDSNDPEDFKAYLQQFPKGKSAAPARTRLADLQAQQLWDSIKDSNDPQDFKAYLQQFPKGKSAATARTRLAGLQEQQLWDSIKDSKNPDDFKTYLRQFPKGASAGLARTRLAQLQPQPEANAATPTTDAQVWDSIKGSNNPADFKKYLDRFPKGKFASVARARLWQLQPHQQATAAAPPSAAPVVPGSRLTGGQIRATIIGNSIQGKSRKGTKFTEFFLSNGTIKELWGDNKYGGKWEIVGDTLCLTYFWGDRNDGCYSVTLGGDAARFTPEKDAEDWLGPLKLVSGNPAGL
jgi:uncharacterized caspase-like protein